VRIETEGDGVAVTADRARVDQAVRNVVENAVKYTRRNGSVRVSI